MKPSFLGLRFVGIVIVALLAATTSPVMSATPPTPASGAAWDPGQRVDYRWKDGSEPPAWMRTAINSAADDVAASSRARTADFDYRDDGPGWIAYTGDIPSTYAVGYAVRNVPSSFGIRMRPQGHVLDWGTLRWCQFYASPPNGCFDAELIALHEFGHVLTLDHVDDDLVTDWTDTVMHWAPKTKAKAGWNQHEYGRCDVARLQVRYGPRRTDTEISTCLDLATELTLTPTVATVSSGASVAFSARLKIAGDAIYPALAADPLSGRSVTLQRRTPGSTQWATIADMTSVADDPGRYTRTQTVTATYEWRALFQAPANEGLEGSSSFVSKVTIGVSCPSVGLTAPTYPTYETC